LKSPAGGEGAPEIKLPFLTVGNMKGTPENCGQLMKEPRRWK
jgi:hypothetical protein